MKAIRKYNAFTLMELLIVMVVFVILFTMSISAFSGLRSTMTLNEGVKNLEQDIRNAQRDALMLTRGKNEKWLYGIGIDFSDFPTTGEYKMFKWCSQYDDFGPLKTKSGFPNYNPANPLSTTNGDFPTTTYAVACPRDGLDSGNDTLVEVVGKDIQRIEYPVMVGINVAIDQFPGYVLFESATGVAYFYKSDGSIINYSNNGNIVSNPRDFEIVLSTVDRKHFRKLRVSHASGKVSLAKMTDLNGWTFQSAP